VNSLITDAVARESLSSLMAGGTLDHGPTICIKDKESSVIATRESSLENGTATSCMDLEE
jgi:hypothetical protein